MSTTNITYERIGPSSGLNKDDVIIAIMGPTGSGKSKIIDTLLGCPGERSGSGLDSCTSEVSAIRIKNHKTLGDRVVLVDTPGFDDSHKSDFEVLQIIAEWLVKAYKQEVTLTAILYLHRITDNRMAGTPHRNLRTFGSICGDTAARSVVLVTTMWDNLKNVNIGEKREQELKSTFWQEMIKNQASVDRFENTPASAWRIVDNIVARHAEGVVLLLQEEIVRFERALRETSAGQQILNHLYDLVTKQKETVKGLKQLEKGHSDPSKAADLTEDIQRIQIQLEKTSEEINRLQLSFRRRLYLFFSRKPKARALNT